MRTGKWHAFMAAAVLSVFLVAGVALAADRAEALKRTSDKLATLYGEKDLQGMMEGVGLFKKAGLSYQPSLVLPLDIIECKNQAELQTNFGAYLFDLNYAMVFGKMKEVAATNAQVVGIIKRLKMDEKVKFKILSTDDLKRISENPTDPATREVFNKCIASSMQGLVTAAQTDPEVLEFATNAVMGATFQCLYVACRLGLAAGPGEKLAALFNEQSSRMSRAQQIIEVLEGDPDLAQFAKTSMRAANIKSDLEVVKEKNGNLDESDLRKILTRLKPVYEAFVGRCK
jgi:hypothetical protein